MSVIVQILSRIPLAALSLLGLLGVQPIVQRQFEGLSLCPALGMVPACYIVLAGYALILFAALVSRRYTGWLFAIGWLPLFTLAATGSGIEIFREGTCPQTSGGVPTCYLSLALLCLLAVAYLAERRIASRNRPGDSANS